MDPRYWTKSVGLIDNAGRLHKVRSTQQATEWLAQWPNKQGEAYTEAIRVCHAVLQRGVRRQVAREAFVLAAQEAGIYALPKRRA